MNTTVLGRVALGASLVVMATLLARRPSWWFRSVNRLHSKPSGQPWDAIMVAMHIECVTFLGCGGVALVLSGWRLGSGRSDPGGLLFAGEWIMINASGLAIAALLVSRLLWDVRNRNRPRL